MHFDQYADLIIRLVVDCAVELRQLGYDVRVVTPHHDRSHCFEETRAAGGLGDVIDVR